MRRVVAISVAVLLLVNVLAARARAETAAERGRSLYKLCQACHSLKEGVTLVGPSLHGLFKRHAASLDSFEYSEALYGADFVWDPPRLSKWLANPAAMFPGNKMLFAGMKDPKQIDDLITFLKEATR